jgi:hypothetical protein
MTTTEHSTIDTSRLPEGERAALEAAEAAREAASEERTLAGGLFFGRADFRRVFPFPEQSAEDRDQGDAFLRQLGQFLREHVDADAIDESGEIPDDVFAGLARLGAFGIKIPVKYGGLGLSQTNYCRAAMLLGSHCGNTTALLSAHQSIGGNTCRVSRAARSRPSRSPSREWAPIPRGWRRAPSPTATGS